MNSVEINCQKEDERMSRIQFSMFEDAFRKIEPFVNYGGFNPYRHEVIHKMAVELDAQTDTETCVIETYAALTRQDIKGIEDAVSLVDMVGMYQALECCYFTIVDGKFAPCPPEKIFYIGKNNQSFVSRCVFNLTGIDYLGEMKYGLSVTDVSDMCKPPAGASVSLGIASQSVNY